MFRAPHLDQLSSLIVPLSLFLSHFLCVSLSPPPSLPLFLSLSLTLFLSLPLSLSLYFYLYLSLSHSISTSTSTSLSFNLFLSLPLSLSVYFYLYLSPRLSSKHFIFLNYHYHFSTSQLHQFNKTIVIQDFCITALLPNLMEGV